MSRTRTGTSRRTILVALAANVVIGLAKLAGGLISGSAAMLAEAAHSGADSFNELALLISIPLGSRPADEEHQFGHGNERFFWAFVVAVAIFVSSAAFSVVEGVNRLIAGGTDGSYAVAYGVLAVAACVELPSFLTALAQLRGQARSTRLRLTRFVLESKDPAPRVVLLEDGAALVGLAVAAAGLAATQLTGNTTWDGTASIVIGLLLSGVALAVGGDARGLLLGESARTDIREDLVRRIEGNRRVGRLASLQTMHLGPDQLLVAARVELPQDVTVGEFDAAREELEAGLREVDPAVAHVFMQPVVADGRPAARPPEGAPGRPSAPRSGV